MMELELELTVFGGPPREREYQTQRYDTTGRRYLAQAVSKVASQ
jgi:hypothetical protein